MDDLQKAMEYVVGLGKRINTIERGSAQPLSMYVDQQSNQSLINPYYMQQQADNSMDAMNMYRQYKNTGNIPEARSSFTPYTPPARQYIANQGSPASNTKVTGGK